MLFIAVVIHVIRRTGTTCGCLLLPGDKDLRMVSRGRWRCHVTLAALRMSAVFWGRRSTDEFYDGSVWGLWF
jgi:hypothetical protein